MRRRKGEPISGWINLDKPLGMTSTQAVGKIRRFLNAQKAGHAGTLDPLATGILPIALGEATKTIPFVQDALKTYSFTITWGEQRDTDDGEGKIIASSDVRPSREAFEALLPRYTGNIRQKPPKFSAIKIDGQRAYDMARDGEDFEISEREVYIESIEILEFSKDSVRCRMTCGKGTYVRSLARDMALELGTYGYISALRREQVGPFTLETAFILDNPNDFSDIAALTRALLPLETSLDDIPALQVQDGEAARLRNGQIVSFIARPDFERLSALGLDKGTRMTALALCKGNPVALVEIEGPDIQPVRVFNV